MRLAVLTCLARMLEIKCEELEGEEGTGSLERDQHILEAAKQSDGESSSHSFSHAATSLLPVVDYGVRAASWQDH